VFDALARAIDRRGRRILVLAVIGAALAAFFGAGVAGRLSPYGAKDPATQSVQATSRYQAVAHRQIEPGLIALIRSGDIAAPAARARVELVARLLSRQPHVVAVRTYYDTHDAALVSFDRRSTYVTAYFRPISDKTVQDQSNHIAALLAGYPWVKLGGTGPVNAQVNHQVSTDLGHAELLAFPFIFLLSLLFFRSLVAAALPPLQVGLPVVFA
jgi:RND superfamily putative drug exporter